MKRVFVVLILLNSVFSQAASDEALKAKAMACVGCHGMNGISNNNLWPNLSGQKKDYLVKQLTAFKKNDRIDPMMNPLAANLSEQDIQDLAQYFSTLK